MYTDSSQHNVRGEVPDCSRQAPESTSMPKTLTVERRCGECQACCVALAVPELGKSRRERCRYQCQAGCAIHSGPLPRRCSEFSCEWLEDNTWPDNLRPDKSGIIFIALEKTWTNQRLYLATQAHPETYRMERNVRWIEHLADTGHAVFVTCGDVSDKDCIICYAAELHPNVTPADIADQVTRLCTHNSEESVDQMNREENDA